MRLELLLRSIALAFAAIGVVTSCSSVEGPEAVTGRFLNELRTHQHIRIALTKVSLGAVETDWLVYKTNDLTP